MPESYKPVVQHKRRYFRKKRFIIPVIVLILLIAFRLYLPTLVKNHVNKVLADIPGYYGQVDDIDIALLRGAYVVNGMYLNKGTSESNIPFLNFPKSDISIQWKSLFHGKIVSEVILDSPEVIYVFEDQKKEIGIAEANDWRKALSALVPIDINNFEVHNGKLAFVQLSANPKVELQISQLELTADNLRIVVEKERILPSPIQATGISTGNGKVFLEGNLNLAKKISEMDLSFSIENADVTAFNDFSNHNAKLNFERGTFSVFTEVEIAKGHLLGYIKPILTDSKLIGEDDNYSENLWEGFVGFFKFALKNKGTDTVETKAPIAGDLNNLEAGVWPTVFNLFKNGWIQAFKEQVPLEINYEEALKNPNLSKKERRELEKKKSLAEKEKRKKQQQVKKG